MYKRQLQSRERIRRLDGDYFLIIGDDLLYKRPCLLMSTLEQALAHAPHWEADVYKRQVAVITKGKFLDCSSAKAQGGIAAVWDRNDSFEDHVADTLDAGAVSYTHLMNRKIPHATRFPRWPCLQ